MKSIIIASIIAASNVYAVESITATDKVHETKKGLASITIAIEFYKLDHNRYPSETEGINALLWKSPSTNRYYLKKKPIDAWGNPYQYSISPCAHAFSLGADGKVGGDGESLDIHYECKNS